MKKLTTWAILLLATTLCCAQQDTTKLKRHTVYVELGGVSFFGATLNYEYTVLQKGIFKLNSGIGAGVIFYAVSDYSEDVYGQVVGYKLEGIVPSLKVVLGKRRHYAELGVYHIISPYIKPTHILYLTQELVGGYRYETLNGRFVGKISFYLVNGGEMLLPWIGLSLGTKF